MNPQTAILSRPLSARADSACLTAPVLIRVPTLTSRARRMSRPAAPRVRRRLRREVRMAAAVLLFALPMSSALFAFPKMVPPSPEAATEGGVVTASVPPSPAPEEEADVTIGLSVAPMPAPSAPGAATSEAEPPVVVPAGYLVPDDRTEETADAGS